MGDAFSRRDFLRVTAGAAAAAAMGAGCGSGSDKPKPSGAAKGGAPQGERTLRIAQFGHFVPAYDEWFDDEYTKRWGEQHDVEVVVDHIFVDQVASRAGAEVAAQQGHDLFGFVTPPPMFEDEVIDHREIVEEVQAKLGKMVPLCERSVLNPKTGKYFGFADNWVANPVHYRVDLWDQVAPGLTPATWDDVLRAAPKLKTLGVPVGIGMAQEVDSTWSLLSVLHSFGSSVQDEEGNVAINRPATVEAVKMVSALYTAGMPEDVFLWDGNSNNRLLTSGKSSMILNGVSAIRAAEEQDPELASQILLAPTPTARPGLGQVRGVYVTGVYVIWKFSRNQEAAKQFLVDLALGYREAFVRSGFYNLPAFPGAIPDLGDLLANDAKAKPGGKYAFLADAEKWSTNIGHAGHANAATDEVYNQFIVPKMFAAAARGEMSPEEAVKAAEAEMKPIFDKWRERGKI
jgi:multiple sugar transport system substrate-binding protein